MAVSAQHDGQPNYAFAANNCYFSLAVGTRCNRDH
jgi:hypothetical protein